MRFERFEGIDVAVEQRDEGVEPFIVEVDELGDFVFIKETRRDNRLDERTTDGGGRHLDRWLLLKVRMECGGQKSLGGGAFG